MVDHRQFITAARDFYNAGPDKFHPGYEQYGDLLVAAEALAQPATAQTAEVEVSEEHRQHARDLLTANDFALNGGHGYRLVEMLAPLFAALATQTERGAVEAMREACAQAVEGLKRKTPYEYNAAPCWGTIKRGAAAIRALTPPVTVAATDQAGEVERLREALSPFAAIPLDGHNTPDGYPDPRLWRAHLVAARAALDTQPATGRTMGGEDGLREAIAAAGTALQNGGE